MDKIHYTSPQSCNFYMFIGPANNSLESSHQISTALGMYHEITLSYFSYLSTTSMPGVK